MGISGVMSAALSGLRVTEQGLELVARNIANVDTPGYTRKTLARESIISGDSSSGVRAAAVTRELSATIQRELRGATSAASQADIIARALSQLDYLFGEGEFADRQRHPMPDLILLDLKMPGIDGFEVLRRIKNAPGIKRIPVVILTSSSEEGDRMLSYDDGANSYLVKPVSFSGFVKVVHQVGDYWLTLNVGAPPVE